MKAPLPLILLVLTACTDSGSGSGTTDAAPAGDTPDASVFDPLTDTLDRAEGVEDTLSDSAAERRRQLEEAEGL